MKTGMEVIASMEVNEFKEAYKIVDFLNKSLNSLNLAFGIKVKEKKYIITIYREE
ncbi:MAG: YpmA family protein [Oscillospiraceae bacterium]|nr:YpmA family protein [Oscillospiraceae bacterium]